MKKLLLSGAALSTVLPAAQAQVTHHDFTDQVLTPSNPALNQLYIDLENGTVSASWIAGADLRFDYATSEQPYVMSYGGWNFLGGFSDPEYYAKGYTAGASLAFSSHVPIATAGRIDLGWPNETDQNTYYLALRNFNNWNEVWIAGVYDADGDSFTVQSFAIAPGWADINAGGLTANAVPEPAETAALMALLAGSAVFFHRRKSGKSQPAR